MKSDNALVAISGQAVLLGAIAFLFKSLISNVLAKDIERYRAELKREGERELEQLKSQLAIVAKEREIRFSKFHDRMAMTIAGTYARIVRLRGAASHYVALFEPVGIPSRSDRREAVREAAQELWEFFDPKRIFLDPDLAPIQA